MGRHPAGGGLGPLHPRGCNLTGVGLHRFFKRGERRQVDAGDGPPPEREDEADDLAARAADLSRSFGQLPPDEQRIAAIERLTELRAAGKVSEENYVKEKRRLERWGQGRR